MVSIFVITSPCYNSLSKWASFSQHVRSETRTAHESERDSKGHTLVWYAVYGSNLLKTRFMCYLEGRAAAPNAKPPERCDAGTAIQEDEQFILNFELYFARKRTETWGRGGVAYVGTESDTAHPTLGRAYLLTRPQLEHVAKWENGGRERVKITQQALRGRPKQILKEGPYPVLLPCGDLKGFPVVTLTCWRRAHKRNSASPCYLNIMLLGLYERYPTKSSSEIVRYVRQANERR